MDRLRKHRAVTSIGTVVTGYLLVSSFVDTFTDHPFIPTIASMVDASGDDVGRVGGQIALLLVLALLVGLQVAIFKGRHSATATTTPQGQAAAAFAQADPNEVERTNLYTNPTSSSLVADLSDRYATGSRFLVELRTTRFPLSERTMEIKRDLREWHQHAGFAMHHYDPMYKTYFDMKPPGSTGYDEAGRDAGAVQRVLEQHLVNLETIIRHVGDGNVSRPLDWRD